MSPEVRRKLRTRARRAAIMILAAVIVAGLPSAVAAAAPASAPQEDLVPLMVVLDASGSMQAEDRMASARKAVGMLADQAPQGAAMGLAVYGTGTGNTPADKPKGCKDVKVLHRPGTVEPGALVASVNDVEPRGYTPIGESLKVAAAQLPKGRPGAIVLVSDGEDTCAPPDPCEVARDLARDGTDLKVHSVGFDVEESAKKQLTCIAQATGGTFTEAPDGEELARVLPRVTRQALRNYEPVGTPIRGGADPSSAPRVDAGTYLDRIGDKETKFYAIDVPEGYTAHATATAVYPDEGAPGPTERLRSQVRDNGGQRTCGRSYTYTRHDLRAASAPQSWTAGGGSGSCSMPGRFYFSVERDKLSRGFDGPVPLELVFMLEPPVEKGGEGERPGAPVSFRQPDGAPEEVTGGGSFSTAPVLDGAGQYTDTLQPGETVFYRVDLAWGQAMAHEVVAAEGPPAMLGMQTFGFGPSRKQLYKSITRTYRGTELRIRPTGAMRPIRYLNRSRTTTIARADDGQAIPGSYYIAVQLVEGPRGPARPVDITLAVSVQGEREPGPSYLGDLKDGRDLPARAAEEEEEDSSSLMSGTGLLLLAGALILLLAVAVVVVVVLLTRRHRHPTPPVPPMGGPGGHAPPPPGPGGHGPPPPGPGGHGLPPQGPPPPF